MNKVIIKGRLTRDPEVRYTTGENAMCTARFSVAVNRKFKNSEGNYDADFISCVAFGKSGEFVEKYFHKGDEIALTGRIQTGSYTNKDGVKVYTTDVVVEETEFCGSKGDNASKANTTPANKGGDFMTIPDGLEEELPFN